MFEAPQTITLADLAQTHSWGETICEPERSQAKAFCDRCRSGSGNYRVRGLVGIARELRNVNGHECPSCGYALFWSRNYVEVVRR